MSGMSNTELEHRLAAAAQSASPDLAGELWEKPVEAAAEDAWFLEQPAPKNGSRSQTIYIISAVAAVLALVIITRSVRMAQTCAMIYLDVNPSIHLEIDRRDRVKSALANNADGEAVLEGMDLSNTDLDVAINAIFGSMVRSGYLSQERNVVLLSVDSRDEEKAEALRMEVSKEIDECLAALLSSATVLDQSFQTDESLESLAELYGITPGKAALIRRLVDANPELMFEELVGLTMGDLVQRLLSQGIELEAYTGVTGVVPTPPPEENAASAAEAETPMPPAAVSPVASAAPAPSAVPSFAPPPFYPADDDGFDTDDFDDFDADDFDDYEDYDDGYDDNDDYDDPDDYDDYDDDDSPGWSAPVAPAPQATAPPADYDDDYDDYDDYDDNDDYDSDDYDFDDHDYDDDDD